MAKHSRIASSRIVLLFLAAIAAASVATAAPPAPRERPADQFIVRFKADPSANSVAATAARQTTLAAAGRAQGLRLQVQRTLAIGAQLVRADRALDAGSAKRLLLQLRADPRVAFAEVDGWVGPAFLPNDASFSQQWALTGEAGGIRAPSAWDVSTGQGVVVGVVDTGVAAHPDLAANIVGGYDFITNLGIAGDGDGRDASYADPGDFTLDGECGFGIAAAPSSWHGTKVAGVIAAVTNNSTDLAGVAFDADVMALRALGRCGGLISDIADAIVWGSGGAVPGLPANTNPVDVLNLSFSGVGPCSPAMQAAIDAAVGAGVVVVAAAGNRNTDVAVETPGSCANVIAVGASDIGGGRAAYSNFGSGIDVVAPGGANANIRVLSDSGVRAPAGAITTGAQGTSLAAAHVSGMVALMQAREVNAPATVASILRGTARPMRVACTQGCGAGIVDASFAVRAARDPALHMEDPPAVVEGNAGTQAVTFTVRLSQALSTPVTFDIATVDGTATAGSDYTAIALAGETFAPGETSRDYIVTVLGDIANEADESFSFAISGIVGAAALDVQAQGTIINDDTQPLVNGVPVPNLSGAYHSERWFVIDVPTGVAQLVIASTGGSGDMDLYVYRGSRTGPQICSGTSVLPTETCSFTNPQAGAYYIRMYGFTSYSGITLTGTYSSPSLSIDDLVVVEGDTGMKSVIAVVRLSSAMAQPVTVFAGFSSGTATLGSDVIEQTATSIRFEPGQVTRFFPVAILGDTAVEPNESFTMTLFNPVGAPIGDAVANATIINNDGPTLRVSDVAIGEGNAGTRIATFTVSLSQAVAGPVTYAIATTNGTATAGSDFVAASLANETIPAGMLSRTFSVTINGDTAVEDTETFGARISQATGATVLHAQGIGNILNDDGPTLSILDASVAEGQSGQKVMVFTVRLSQPAPNDVTYRVTTANGSATAGSDYTPITVYAFMAAGDTVRTYQVYVASDTTVEANETVVVNLTHAVGASLYDWQAIGTIVNDDGPTLSINDVAISEGNAGTKVATFTVSLSQAAAVPVTYDVATSNLTATAGADYVARALAGETIPAGQLSKTFTVTLNGDAAVEANETFRATLGNISAGATLFKHVGTGTITNDD